MQSLPEPAVTSLEIRQVQSQSQAHWPPAHRVKSPSFCNFNVQSKIGQNPHPPQPPEATFKSLYGQRANTGNMWGGGVKKYEARRAKHRRTDGPPCCFAFSLPVSSRGRPRYEIKRTSTYYDSRTNGQPASQFKWQNKFRLEGGSYDWQGRGDHRGCFRHWKGSRTCFCTARHESNHRRRRSWWRKKLSRADWTLP